MGSVSQRLSCLWNPLRTAGDILVFPWLCFLFGRFLVQFMVVSILGVWLFGILAKPVLFLVEIVLPQDPLPIRTNPTAAFRA